MQKNLIHFKSGEVLRLIASTYGFILAAHGIKRYSFGKIIIIRNNQKTVLP